MWKPGQKLISETNRELGAGVVLSVEGRFVNVFFPDAGTHLRMSPEAAGIRPVEFAAGDSVRLGDGRSATIRAIRGRMVKLDDGTMVDLADVWPDVSTQTPIDRLMARDVDDVLDVLNRVDGQRLLNYRRRGGVASLVGGRVELFGHQVDTAARAIEDEQVRWLLADGVGLGKTVVACMITSALVRMGRVEQAVIVAPETLTLQWLGELYRKFHQVFVHIDRERLRHVRSDFGEDANPFDVHRLSIVSTELLVGEPWLRASLERAEPQLVVVDEAHRTLGSGLAEAILPLVGRVPHALLLTASPFQNGPRGFLELVEALRLPHVERDGVHIVERVSAVTRDDLESFPARRPRAVTLAGPCSESLGEDDPRVAWLLEQADGWQAADEKVLVFVETAARARALSDLLARVTGRRVFTFHEEMGSKKRDIELAQFRISGATFLVSSGAGGEGRNFQFCDLMVHVDLPDDPIVLEQRIGRLDRIGREEDIPIVYFRTSGAEDRRAELYERLGIFEDAAVGASVVMSEVAERLTHAGDGFDVVSQAEELRSRVRTEAGVWQFPDSHSGEVARAVIEAIPDDLDEVLQRFCVDAAERVGMEVVVREGRGTYYFEYGANVEVETIPGLPVGARFLGTFDREAAVADESLDFFASGHPLVEGLLYELEDSARGRVGALRLARRQFEELHGLYLVVVEGKEAIGTPRLIPLMHAGEPLDSEASRRLAARVFDMLELGIALEPDRLSTLLQRVFAQPLLKELDPHDVAQAILVAVMD